MKIFSGYKLIDANDDEGSRGTIWWDGARIRASSDELLSRIKRTVIPFSTSVKEGAPTYKDGEKFFDMLPLAFRTGYLNLKSIKVDENGKEV